MGVFYAGCGRQAHHSFPLPFGCQRPLFRGFPPYPYLPETPFYPCSTSSRACDPFLSLGETPDLVTISPPLHCRRLLATRPTCISPLFYLSLPKVMGRINYRRQNSPFFPQRQERRTEFGWEHFPSIPPRAFQEEPQQSKLRFALPFSQ